MSETEAVLAAYERGEISPEIALMRLLLAFGSAPAAVARLEQNGQADLLRLARANRAGLGDVETLVAAGLARERTGSIAAIRAQFDEAVRLAPEASVALYSLGSPETLARTTAELVERLRQWRLLGPEIGVLDLGCGIGRVALALAPYVAHVTGTDVSPAMVAEAGRRCRGIPNIDFAVCDGTGLREFAGRNFGLIVAVDVFPYLVAAGPRIAEQHSLRARPVPIS